MAFWKNNHHLKYEQFMKWHCGVCLYIYKWLGFASPIQAHATTDWTNKKGKLNNRTPKDKKTKYEGERSGVSRWAACENTHFLANALFVNFGAF